MRNKLASATARYLTNKPMLLAFLAIGIADATRALVVGGLAGVAS